MVKNFLLLLVSLTLAPWFSEAGIASELEPRPLAGVGFRLGNGSSSDEAAAGYFFGKLNWLRFGDYQYFSFLSPGIGIQTDGKFHGSVAPFIYSLDSGFAVGFDLIFPKNDKQNIFGVFIGYEFLP